MDYSSLKANMERRTRYTPKPKPNTSQETSDNSRLFVSKLFSYLICHGEECRLPLFSVAKRLQKFSGDKTYDNKKALELVNANRERFVVKTVEGEKYVEAKTSVKICDLYQVGKCRATLCNGLHICRFFLEETCKFGDECKKPHRFDIPETKALLLRHRLENLPPDALKSLFRKVLDEKKIRHASCTSGPSACKFYNKGECKNGDKCQFLHVCEHYIDGDCTFGTRCKRHHSFETTHARKVLATHNLGSVLNDKQILSELRQDRIPSEESRSSGKEDDFVGILLDLATGGKRKAPSKSGPSMSPCAESTTENSEICGFNLRGKCSYGNMCNALHTRLPYQWQYSLGSKWSNFLGDVNRETEKKFCDHEVVTVIVHLADFGALTVDFQKMVAHREDSLTLPVRRLSTVSSVLVPSGHVFRTTWKWYWRNEHDQWHCYDDGKAQTTSEKIEQDFQSDSGERNHKFSTNSQKYTLYFDDIKNLYQQNDMFGTRRDVRRRPDRYLDEKEMKKILEDFKRNRQRTTSVGSGAASYPMPSTWTPTDPSEEFNVVDLSEGSHHDEYLEVKAQFMKTMPGHEVKSVKRVQNPGLWEDYERQKSKITKKNSGQSPEERWLFHGTSKDIVEAICQQGFDWRLSGSKHGARYGKGSYFAVEAAYSHNYSGKVISQDFYRVFMAKVIVGSYVAGSYETQRPPAKDPADPLSPLHDSCVNSVTKPTIFVVFERSQAYPYYIIDYTN